MKFLLDTCVLSELTKPRPAAQVVEWLSALEDEATAVSVLTLGELEKGVERLASGKQKQALRTWLSQLRDVYEDRILDVTAAVAKEWGRVAAAAEKRGTPLPVIDALIGATARVHGLSVATRNIVDIGRTGAAVFNPWE